MKRTSFFASSVCVLVTGLVFLFVPGGAQAANATISGKVTHAVDGTPVESLLIYAERYDTGVLENDYTDANGDFSISVDDLGDGTDGTYSIYNYTSTTDETNVVFTRANTSVTISDGENRTGVNFSVTRRARAQGYVYESDGTTPVYGALVYYLRDSVWTDGYGTDYTTAGGFYSVAPATYPNPTTTAVGSYTVQVTALGYFAAELNDVALSADEATITQNVTMTAASTVSGTVTDTTGTPLSGIDLLLDDVNSYYRYLATTDANGNYTVWVFDQYDYNGTAVGEYTLTASGDNYTSRSQNVVISEDESSLTDVDFSLRRAGQISGSVVDQDTNAPLVGITISGLDGFGTTYTTTTDSNGAFTLTNLRPSSGYSVTASFSGYVTESFYDLKVTADETTTLDDPFTLLAATTFSGQVVSKNGNDPLSGATIKLFNRSKPRSTSYDYTTTTASDGTFAFNSLAPSGYRVEVSLGGYVLLRKNLIDLRESLEDRTFRLEEGATITGIVRSQGNPVYQALVTVYSKNPSTTGYSTDYTDINGRYYIRGLEPGKYTIKISSTGFVEKTIQKRLTSGDTTNLNMSVGPAGSISGYVRDAVTGLPLSGYSVRVRNQSVSAYTDSNGYYIIDSLASGRYKLDVYSTFYQSEHSKKIRVRSNQVTQPVNFELQPKAE